jgi:predicted nuclease with TOPRIM domain
MYLNREKLLSISAPKVDVEELKEKLKGEVEQQSRQLQTNLNGLVTENLELKTRMARMELENVDLKGRIQKTEQKLGELEKLVKEALEQTS